MDIITEGRVFKATPELHARRMCNPLRPASTHRILCPDDYPYNELVIRMRTMPIHCSEALDTMNAVLHLE